MPTNEKKKKSKYREVVEKLTSPVAMLIEGLLAIFVVATILFSPSYMASAAVYTGVSYSDFNNLEQEIQNLQTRVASLESRLQVAQTTVPPPGVYYTPPPTYTYTHAYAPTPSVPNSGVNSAATGPVYIDQNGGSFSSPWDIYFTGHGFASNEPVIISEDGQLVGQTHADSGGNISPNGILLNLGTHNFIFTGQSSGISAVATVHGVRDVIFHTQ